MIAGIGAVSLPASLSGLGSTAKSAASSALREATANASAHAGGLSSIGTLGSGEAASGANTTGAEALSGTEGVNGAEGLGSGEGLGGGAGTGSGGFGEALTSAISSLEKSQTNASSVSQALASGTVSDPESAVVTVEEAQLAMQLASQIRTKATEAITQIFQTQV
jgi:flagellar hook-basal body complex protein FliE